MLGSWRIFLILLFFMIGGNGLTNASVVDLYQQVRGMARDYFHKTYMQCLSIVPGEQHVGEVAVVRTSSAISVEEAAFLAKRRPRVQKALQTLFCMQFPYDRVPRISLVMSGGGYRALITSLAFCSALEKAGVMGCVTYMAGLSGSTWMMAPWFSGTLSLAEYVCSVRNNVSWKKRMITKQEIRLIEQALRSKILLQQPTSVVDMFGLLVGTALLRDFGNDRHRVYLSGQAARIADGSVPFPLYSIVYADDPVSSHWFECNPFEFGSVWLQAFIPVWASGRRFCYGVSQDSAIEQPLSFFLGAWGSAMGASFGDMYERGKDDLKNPVAQLFLETLFRPIAIHPRMKTMRLTTARFHNFTYQLPGSPVADQQELRLVDAGARPGFNLPYPLVSEERAGRQSDIIIICDASSQLPIGKELYQAERYARKHGLKFPLLPPAIDQTKALQLFYDEHDQTTPVVIYMPLVNDNTVVDRLSLNNANEYKSFLVRDAIKYGFCSTDNFHYSPEQFDTLFSFVQANVLTYIDEIKHGIKIGIDRTQSSSH